MIANATRRLYTVYLWAVLACLAPTALAGTPVIARFGDRRPIIIAHRGCWRLTGENALSGLKACAALGVDIVEVDIRVTKDGELVLMHDDTMDRMTDIDGKVEDLTLGQFKSAHLHRGSGGRNTPLMDEAPPTFIDELRAAKGNVGLFLDIKIPSAKEKIYKTIEREGAQDWVVLGADAAEFQRSPDWVKRHTIVSAVQCGTAGITSACFPNLIQAIDAYRRLHPLALGVIFKSDDFLTGAAAAFRDGCAATGMAGSRVRGGQRRS
jgi:hypothetical protein